VLGLALLSFISYSCFAFILDRRDFYELLLYFAVPFGAYFYIVTKAKQHLVSYYIALGILFRCLFLWCIPPLSDDYFRFIWDGQLIASGLNPFDLLPTEVVIDFPNKKTLFEGMNSPNYYTVYPPVPQIIYFLSAKLSPNSILGSIIVMRSIILVAEIGTVMLLPRLLNLLNINPINSLWYVLNPLIIVELTGNLHFEGIVIFFFLLAIYLLVLNNQKLSSIPWALAAATKLIPIFFLPIILRKIKFKKSFFFYFLFGICFTVLWLPFFNDTLFPHFKKSVDLYYETFEFNASIYYLIRWIGFKIVGYNIIGVAGSWLSKIALIGMFILLVRKRNVDWNHFFNALLFALSLYYALALIVHPWYICLLVFLSVFSKFRYAIIWSTLAVLSYWAYSNPNYQENYWLIALEYSIVIFFFLRELFMKKNSFLSLEKSNS